MALTGPSKRLVAGFQLCTVYDLDADGYINAPNENEYAGTHLVAAKALEVTTPQPQQVVHRGDNGIYSLDMLPPSEPFTAKIMSGAINDELDELATGVKSRGVNSTAGARIMGFGTNKQGSERQLAVFGYQQAQDGDPTSPTYGLRRWNLILFPKAILVPSIAGMSGVSADPGETGYEVYPQYSTSHLWGTAYTTADDGYTRGQGTRGATTYKPRIVAFKGDGVANDFWFDIDFPAFAATNVYMTVIKEGVDVTATVTLLTTGVTFPSPVTAGHRITVFYQTAA